jgi:6-phosphogluconolactonase (cycloisomerase 2 family)
LALSALSVVPVTALAVEPGGAVYTLTNQTDGNFVQVFARASDGSLAPAGAFDTGGTGTGGGLGNQGAVVLHGNRLLAVSAGSNEVSSFQVGADGLTLSLRDTEPSGGAAPISVTASGKLVYVLNAGDAGHAGNITGFRVGPQATLIPIPGSTRPLSADAVGPAQIQFALGGAVLVVTEKATNLIDTYTVGTDGLATGPTSRASNGATPFGFAVRGNKVFVSEAFGGAPDVSATSSYTVGGDGTLSLVSGSVATTETAACWVVLSRGGKFAYVTNTGSNTISGYRVAADGSIALLDADGVTASAGAGPIDAAVSRLGGFLYTLNAGAHTISGFAIQGDGSLVSVSGATGLPAGATGLAAL